MLEERIELIKLRKYQDNLVIGGTAVIAFGLWSLIRLILFFVINKGMLRQFLEDFSLLEDDMATVKIITVLIFMLVVVGLYIYVGLSARADGKEQGNKKRYGYRILIVLLVLSNLLEGVGTAADSINTGDTEAWDTMLSSGLVDLTVFILLIHLFVSSIRVGKLKKALAAEDSGSEAVCR